MGPWSYRIVRARRIVHARGRHACQSSLTSAPTSNLLRESTYLWLSRNLPRLAYAEPFGHQDQVGQRLRRHFVDHMAPMLLYGFLGDAELGGNLLVQETGCDNRLPRGSPETRAQNRAPAALAA